MLMNFPFNLILFYLILLNDFYNLKNLIFIYEFFRNSFMNYRNFNKNLMNKHTYKKKYIYKKKY